MKQNVASIELYRISGRVNQNGIVSKLVWRDVVRKKKRFYYHPWRYNPKGNNFTCSRILLMEPCNWGCTFCSTEKCVWGFVWLENMGEAQLWMFLHRNGGSYTWKLLCPCAQHMLARVSIDMTFGCTAITLAAGKIKVMVGLCRINIHWYAGSSSLFDMCYVSIYHWIIHIESCFVELVFVATGMFIYCIWWSDRQI